jgi:hypothetical protein
VCCALKGWKQTTWIIIWERKCWWVGLCFSVFSSRYISLNEVTRILGFEFKQGQNFFSSSPCPDRMWDQLIFVSLGYWYFSSCEADHSFAFSVNTNSAWSFAFTSPIRHHDVAVDTEITLRINVMSRQTSFDCSSDYNEWLYNCCLLITRKFTSDHEKRYTRQLVLSPYSNQLTLAVFFIVLFWMYQVKFSKRKHQNSLYWNYFFLLSFGNF